MSVRFIRFLTLVKIYFYDFQMLSNEFKDRHFKSLLCRMNPGQIRVARELELSDEKIEVCGNLPWGIQTLQKRAKFNKRACLEWVPPVDNLNVLEQSTR